MIDFEADAAQPQEHLSSLERAIRMGELLVQLRANVDALEKQLAVAKADVRRVEQEDLPELMNELNLETFRLKSGETIEVVQEINCAITEEKRRAAHDWLSAHGFGGLIKTEVVVTFGRGEHDAAEEFVGEVQGKGHAPDLVERVHPSTLKSFIKEQMEKGAQVPFDLFGVFPYNKVKISLKK